MQFGLSAATLTGVFLAAFHQLLSHVGDVAVADHGQQRVLKAVLDRAAAVGGQRSWCPPVVMPVWQLVRQRALAEGATATLTAPFEFVLSDDQEVALWQRIIRDDMGAEIGVGEQTARLAQTAWRVQQLWPIEAQTTDRHTQDSAAYARWSAHFTKRCRALGAIDPATLLVAQATSGAAGRPLIAHALLQAPPGIREWLLAAGGVLKDVPRGSTASFGGHGYVSRDQEYRAAAAWAGERAAADPGARIALVVPNGDWQEQQLERCIAECLGEQGAQSVCWARPQRVLDRAPLLRLAMLVLELEAVPKWDALSALIVHPLLTGADSEWSARARFDDDLRNFDRFEMPLAFVINHLAELEVCPQLEQVLQALVREIETLPARQTMAEWLQHFERCLKLVSWPGHAVDTLTHRPAYEHWTRCCDRLSGLDAVLAPVTRAAALSRLRALLAQPDQPLPAAGAQICVVTAEQAMSIAPSDVWVLGCESERLIATPSLSPLLPVAVQRTAGVPGAEPQYGLWFTRTLLETLAGQARCCEASYVVGDGDLKFAPASIIPGLHKAPTEDDRGYLPARWQRSGRAFETISDEAGPALPDGSRLRGGVSSLMAQNACPFRAFARVRLNASCLTEPRPGIAFRHKGIFVHRALASIWRELGTSACLAEMSGESRAELLEQVVRRTLTRLPFETEIERALHFIEQARLERLFGQWLTFELERESFSVIATEQEYSVDIAGLRITTRIDRVDRLDDGRIQIIDYKTGTCSVQRWLVPRMDDPQLPFYAYTAPLERVDSICFAAVDASSMRWLNWQNDDDSQSPEAAWRQVRANWADDLETTAAELQSGAASPHPKYGDDTCAGCDQALFCRRAERENVNASMHDG